MASSELFAKSSVNIDPPKGLKWGMTPKEVSQQFLPLDEYTGDKPYKEVWGFAPGQQCSFGEFVINRMHFHFYPRDGKVVLSYVHVPWHSDDTLVSGDRSIGVDSLLTESVSDVFTARYGEPDSVATEYINGSLYKLSWYYDSSGNYIRLAIWMNSDGGRLVIVGWSADYFSKFCKDDEKKSNAAKAKDSGF
jgi:hypothetical protein